MKLFIIPQLPIKMRYQGFWWREMFENLKEYFNEVELLSEWWYETVLEASKDDFSNVRMSIKTELEHTNVFLNKLEDFKEDDILLHCDLSFPGFFHNILHHYPIKNAFCYCHATSLNNLDYFKNVRKTKWLYEKATIGLYKKVFVGSEYHRKKLNQKNVITVGVPKPPYETFKEEKIYDIISVARNNEQKITKKLEDLVEKDFGPIIRKKCDTWEDYYKFLSQGKILLITAKEETFGYSALEANMNNTVVLAPNAFSYPELFKEEYLYKDYEELKNKITNILNSENYKVPKMNNIELVENFYENISKIMKGSI